MSRIVWTPVPNGYDSKGKLRLSVLVSPKLIGADALSGYADWLKWPAVKPTFTVSFNGTKAKAAVTSTAQLKLWQALFNADTPVTPEPVTPMKVAGVPVVRSWPAVSARKMAAVTHAGTMADSPTKPPTARYYAPIEELASNDSVLDIYLPPGELGVAELVIGTVLADQGYFLGGAIGEDFSAAQVDFLLADLFHDRKVDRTLAAKGRSLRAHVARINAASDMDFHAALGSFAQYPQLQRALGLIVDLTVDPADIAAPVPSDPVSVAVEATWTPSGSDQYDATYPVVTATLTKTVFRAKPATSVQKDGLLQLNDTEQFNVMEVDVDGSAGALSSFSQTLNAVLNRNGGGVGSDIDPPAEGPQTPEPLPSLRSNGFSIVQTGRAKVLYESLVKTVSRMGNLTALADDPFTAEDVTYGVRLDVWDDHSKSWHSLCQRKGTYDLNGTKFTADDEGVIHLAHSQTLDDDSTIYLHEAVAAWSGYSAVANRPGSTQETVNGKNVTVGADSDATSPVKLHTSFQPHGLPKLRYGRSYRFRARVVDIAGNSLGPGEPAAADFTASSEPIKYSRFEPVGSPVLLPTAPRTVGESSAVMVIRGNYDKPSTEDSQRYVVPHRSDQNMAERHGRYDVTPSPLNPGGIDTFAYDEVVRRDHGSLDDDGKTDPDGWGTVHYYDQPFLDVPYIPDVLSRGAGFLGLPGMGADDVFPVRFDDGLPWPTRNPFRIRIVNGTGKPAYNKASRVLTVKLPPGRSFDVDCSSLIDDPDIDLLGVWNWFIESGLDPSGGLTVADLRKLAANGRLWQLTPSQPLTLVHASRQPILPPTFAKPVAIRKPGDTTAKIVDTLGFDRPSTAQVGIQASWVEPIDVLGNPGPTQLSTAGAHVVNLAAEADSSDGDKIKLDDLQEFHDTKHRNVTYSAIGSSRFVEYFKQTKNVSLKGTTPVVLATGGIGAGTLLVADPATGTAFVEDHSDVGGPAGDYVTDPGAGTVARSASGSAIADGATVSTVFVAGSVTRVNSESQQPITVNVRSSARPAAPDIAYLIPTFGWEKTTDTNSISSVRRGNGLRVYLRRPWYSSGDGENLGVVLFDGKGSIDPGLKQYVTLRGQDPLFASPTTLATPGMSEFPLAIHPKSGYKLAESALSTVAVAPHAVGYDENRQMWYCDITMTQDKSYSPFLRFALARFQVNSLTGVELSPVILAQFAQLNPDRTLSTVFSASDKTSVTVAVAGLTYGAGNAKPAKVKVLVQVADPKPAGTLGWKTASTTELSASSSGSQWTGTITLPAARGSQPMRLVVEERETLSNDSGRLLYADAVEI